MPRRRSFPYLLTTLALLMSVTGLAAQEARSGPQEVGTAEAGVAAQAPGSLITIPWHSVLPEPTAAQVQQLRFWTDRTHLPGPPRSIGAGVPEASFAPGTESTLSSLPSMNDPLADPNQASTFLDKNVGPLIPDGYLSNVAEASAGVGGRYAFLSGNWFAARSTNGGENWNYVSAFDGFPDFCCDQVATYDAGRNAHLWLRMGLPDGNGENVFKIGVSTNGAKSFCTYTAAPKNVNGTWTNEWWDYPHIQLGMDYLYLAWNVFSQGGSWTRTVLLRWPLDAMADCAGFSYNYFAQSDWFTVVPVQGSDHQVHFASNWPTDGTQWNSLRIWSWSEDSTSISYVTRTVEPWNYSGLSCGTPGDWLGRADDRLLSGARYMVNSDGIDHDRIPGRTLIGWWWNSGSGGAFPKPYIEAASFYEDTKTQVAGYLGRPYVYNTSTCFGYPSLAANQCGDLGMVFHYGSTWAQRPSVAFSVADDYVGAPPGWSFYPVRGSRATPSDNKWGDYNTCRVSQPAPRVWIAGSHFIPTEGDCSNCAWPVYFAFGRERDRQAWKRWHQK